MFNLPSACFVYLFMLVIRIPYAIRKISIGMSNSLVNNINNSYRQVSALGARAHREKNLL